MILGDSIARFGIATLLCCTSGLAVAQTAAQKMTICEKAGVVAEATVGVRDAGVPVEEALAVNQTLGLGKDVLALFDALVTLTYVMNGVEGPVMKQVAIQMCHKSMGLK